MLLLLQLSVVCSFRTVAETKSIHQANCYEFQSFDTKFSGSTAPSPTTATKLFNKKSTIVSQFELKWILWHFVKNTLFYTEILISF